MTGPVSRIPVEMSDGNDQDLIAFELVNHTVRNRTFTGQQTPGRPHPRGTPSFGRPRRRPVGSRPPWPKARRSARRADRDLQGVIRPGRRSAAGRTRAFSRICFVIVDMTAFHPGSTAFFPNFDHSRSRRRSSKLRRQGANGQLLPWHRRSSYEPDAPARGVPQSPRWRVGLICAKDAKLSCRGNISHVGQASAPDAAWKGWRALTQSHSSPVRHP